MTNDMTARLQLLDKGDRQIETERQGRRGDIDSRRRVHQL